MSLLQIQGSNYYPKDIYFIFYEEFLLKPMFTNNFDLFSVEGFSEVSSDSSNADGSKSKPYLVNGAGFGKAVKLAKLLEPTQLDDDSIDYFKFSIAELAENVDASIAELVENVDAGLAELVENVDAGLTASVVEGDSTGFAVVKVVVKVGKEGELKQLYLTSKFILNAFSSLIPRLLVLVTSTITIPIPPS